MDNRYQYQPWYVKLWRMRHLPLVPFVALKAIWWHALHNGVGYCRTNWSIAKGLAHCKMNYVYTSDEVFGDRPKINYWNYRVVEQKGLLEVLEVYYGPNDEVLFVEENYPGILGNDMDELKRCLEKQIEALNRPILKWEPDDQ